MSELAGATKGARRPAIPVAKIADLRGATRRLLLLRAVFAAACVTLLLFAFVAARRASASSGDVLPAAGSMVVLDASTSIRPFVYPQIAAALDDLARSSRRTGLVLFSDVAYEALPPSTPARELSSVARFFKPEGERYPTNPWTLNFTRGTRISDGIELAQTILARDGMSKAGIVLVSDLATAASDLDELTRVLVELQRSHIPVVIVPLDAAPSDRSYFSRLLGPSVFHEPHAETDSSKASSTRSAAFPVGLATAGGLLLILLALGERMLARLTWRPRTASEDGGR
jgi:hypothetical protein